MVDLFLGILGVDLIVIEKVDRWLILVVNFVSLFNWLIISVKDFNIILKVVVVWVIIFIFNLLESIWGLIIIVGNVKVINL